jgi:hypothetical protein
MKRQQHGDHGEFNWYSSVSSVVSVPPCESLNYIFIRVIR